LPDGYEAMIDNLETEARRLIEFCGLQRQASCLEFHKTQRVVETASFMLVRQPIYKTSKN